MTIVKKTSSLKHYPHKAIQEDVVEFLLAKMDKSNNHTNPIIVIKLFECFCDVTNNEITDIMIERRSFSELLYSFIGALLSGEFLECSHESRMYYADMIYSVAIKINPYVIRDSRQNTIKQREFIRENKSLFIKKWNEIEPIICQIRKKYWNGFSVISRKGQTTYLSLQGVHEKYSPDFAYKIHNKISSYMLKMARIRTDIFNDLFCYLTKNHHIYNVDDFRCPDKINTIMKECCRFYFKNNIEKKRDVISIAHSWNQFCVGVENSLIKSGLWVMPISGQLPRVPCIGRSLRQTNIRLGKGGIDVKRKLLTDVPINLTDEAALKFLFLEIENDMNEVLNWAKFNAKNIYDRRKNSKKISREGNVINKIKKGISDDELFRDISKTIENKGVYKGVFTPYAYRFSSKELMYKLGFPRKSIDFLAHHILLINEHPEITQEYLNNFELYDIKGNLSGFVKIDDTYYLTGYKDRRKRMLSEQVIKLNDISVRLIKEIIEITSVLREKLKKENNDLWRYLFIFSGSFFNNSYKIRNLTFNRSQRDLSDSGYLLFRDEFKLFSNKRGEDLDQFIWRISPTTIRSSRALLIYLETKDIRIMSAALGHANPNKDLLREYLPEPILSFFQSRWIRIFQKGIICEAMKDSIYFFESTNFKNMNQLNDFLFNHTIKNIPVSAMDKDNISKELVFDKNKSQVYFSVNESILVVLLSLEDAVNKSVNKEVISGYAHYWCQVSKLISKEIERGNDRRLKSYLLQAKKLVKPNIMEGFIYGATK